MHARDNNLPLLDAPFRARHSFEYRAVLLRVMSFKRKLISGLVAAIAILLGVAAMSYSSLLRSGEDRQWVVHTHQVLEELDAVRIAMTDAETGERGFIVTGETSYLGPYNRGIVWVDRSVEQVRELTS